MSGVIHKYIRYNNREVMKDVLIALHAACMFTYRTSKSSAVAMKTAPVTGSTPKLPAASNSLMTRYLGGGVAGEEGSVRIRTCVTTMCVPYVLMKKDGT